MHSRLRLSLFIGLAALGVVIADSLIRAPDTVNGVPIPGYLWTRLALGAFSAALCVLGCFLGFRLGNVQRLSLLKGVVIVALYAAIMYMPIAPATVTLDASGEVQASTGAWWSLAAPFLAPFLLALIVPRLPFGSWPS